MAQPATIALTMLQGMLGDTSYGVNSELAQMVFDFPEIELLRGSQIPAINVAQELAEKTAAATYPAAYVYCEKVINDLKEKFRTFSGTVQLAIDVRVTHDQLMGVAILTQKYADAVTAVLHKVRGRWTDGIFFPGGYEVAYGPVKRGGKNYIQSATVTLDVKVSI